MATLNGQSAQAPVLPEVIATKRRELLQACKIAASQSSKSLEEITTSARKRQKIVHQNVCISLENAQQIQTASKEEQAKAQKASNSTAASIAAASKAASDRALTKLQEMSKAKCSALAALAQ